MKKILLIEDDVWERELLKDLLEHAGYEVFEAPDGEIGMQLYRQHPCDLVVTDIYMPNKDGLETILELKQYVLATPIIVVSGGGERARQIGYSGAELVLSAAEGLGADRTLQKPVEVREFLAVVEELLSARTHQPQICQDTMDETAAKNVTCKERRAEAKKVRRADGK